MHVFIGFITVWVASSVPLPGGAPVGMDYLAHDAANHRVWIPAGNTGKVDVLDTTTLKLTSLGDFATIASSRPGATKMGPSSVTVGDGVVWVGNRGDNRLCAFDARTLEKQRCIQLSRMPDGIQYIAATHELWATTPRDKSIAVVSTVTSAAATISVPGEPEGYAVDAEHGLFYTNLEDKDKTLTIDVATHKILATWSTGCGGEGPRGLAIDVPHHLLFVACVDGALVLDLAHDGKQLARLKTGKGVDNIDFHAGKRLLYIASRDDATLTIAHIDEQGTTQVVATAHTAKGARNAVVDHAGNAYVADSVGGTVIVVRAP